MSISTIFPKEVMIVGHSGSFRLIASENMARSGWQTHWRSSGRDALASLQLRPTPIVLCSEKMPDMSWREFQQRLIDARVETLLIVASPGIDSTLWAEVINAGGFDLLVEPCSVSDVEWLLEAAHRFQSASSEVSNLESMAKLEMASPR